MKEFQDLVTINVWTFIFTIGNLLILTAGLKHFLFKPVQQILAARKSQVDTLYTDAETAKTAAEDMKCEYETRLGEAKTEATAIVKDATATAAVRADALVNEAKNEAAAVKAKAEADIERERKKAASELKNDISALALDLAGKVVEKEINPDTHKALIDAFINNVGDAS
ncbi:MAG: F0F1 ATP synthase subunit B [Oscillospiraceae bacterium]|nr:F0F1 ATP synthase subunit B [Oscillospiraceae bacterium]